jgi:hypothetical protein
VILRAREVLEEVAERLGRHDAEVEAEPVARDDGRLGVALGGDVDYPLQACKVPCQFGGVARARDDVEVAEGLLPAAHRPCFRDRDGRRQLPQRGDRRLHCRQPRAEQVPPRLRALGLVRERGENLLLALRPEAGERAQPLGLGCRLELVERLDAELAPDASRRLGAETRELHEEDDLGRHAGLLLRQRLDLAALDDLDDLLLDRLADALQFLRLPIESELRDGARRLPYPRGRPAVRDDPEGVLAFELEQVPQEVELVGDVRIARQLSHEAMI